MPRELEKKLKRYTMKEFGSTTSKRARAVIYGTLRKAGWEPGMKKAESHSRVVMKRSGGKVGRY